MAEATKITGDGISGATIVDRTGGDRFDGSAYSASDQAQFEMLSDMSRISLHHGTGTAPRGVDAEMAPVPSAFDYTEADSRAFDQLMEELKGYRGKRRSAKPSTGSSGSFGYTDQDARQFADLMPPELGPSQITPPPRPPAATDPEEDHFQYTRQDNEAFRKIMPEIPGEEDLRRDEHKTLRSRSDRDVGTIRIVDFDREHARAKENKRRGRPDIKIRYFD